MAEDDPLNTADPRAVRERARREQREIDQAHEDLRELLALPAGRRFVWRLFGAEYTRVFSSSYHSSGQQFAHNEGRRSIGVQLMGELMQVDPDGWVALQRELIERLKG